MEFLNILIINRLTISNRCFMYEIPIQPLSQNQAWAGKRWKSQDYKTYEAALQIYFHKFTLPKLKKKERFYLYLEFGATYRQDCSNGIKLFEDCLCKFLGVDDRDVMAIFTRKIITKKVDSFIRFNIFMSEHELIEAINNE